MMHGGTMQQQKAGTNGALAIRKSISPPVHLFLSQSVRHRFQRLLCRGGDISISCKETNKKKTLSLPSFFPSLSIVLVRPKMVVDTTTTTTVITT